MAVSLAQMIDEKCNKNIEEKKNFLMFDWNKDGNGTVSPTPTGCFVYVRSPH